MNGDHAVQMFFALDALKFELYFSLFFGFCAFEAPLFALLFFEFTLDLTFFALLIADDAAFLGFLIALLAGIAGVGALGDAQEGCDLAVGLDDCGFGHVWE